MGANKFYSKLKAQLSSSKSKELQGHKQKVLTVGWSCDGRRLASGSMDQTVRVHLNVESINEDSTLELKGHKGDVEQLSWDPTHSECLATTSLDCSVIIWDLRSKKVPERKIPTLGENINICWSPSGKTIAIGNKEDVVSFIDLRGGTDASGEKTYISNTIKNNIEVNEISWSNDGNLFFLTTGQGEIFSKLLIRKGSIQVIEFPAFKRLPDIIAHTANCYCIEFDPVGKYFATGSADSTVGLWCIRDLVCIKTFCNLEWPIRTLSFSFDGELIASGSEDRFVDISAVETGESMHKIPCSAATNSIAWHPYLYLLACAGDDSKDRDSNGSLRVFGLP